MCLKLDLAPLEETLLLISCSVGYYQEYSMHPGLFLSLIQAYHYYTEATLTDSAKS